jgi:hypothetical protein
MEINFDLGNENRDGSNNGSNMSLRSLVSKNQESLHKFSSRLGDVNKLARQLEELMMVLDGQKEWLSKETRLIRRTMEGTNTDVGMKLEKIGEVLLSNIERVNLVTKGVKDEAKEIKKIKEEMCERMEKVEGAINKRIKRQRYIWAGVGVLCLSLVVCLGYYCNEMSHMSKEMQKLQTNIDVSMTEIKGAILVREVEKVNQEKANIVGKGKR